MRTSNELKISIEAAWLACPKRKDERHLLSLPVFITLAEFDPTDQRVRSGMSVRTKMLCDMKTMRNQGKHQFRWTSECYRGWVENGALVQEVF